MRWTPPLALALLLLAGCARTAGPLHDQAPTTFLLVRHAERLDASDDPPLNDAGRARAEALREALRDAGVEAVVVSQYRRTAETARPLAEALGLGLHERSLGSADTPAAARRLAGELLAEYAGRTVLVVGHSNTVPAMLGALTGAEPPELEGYGDLFVVTVPPGGAAPRVVRARVGG